MTDVIIASSPQDARLLEEVENHHAELNGGTAQRVASLTTAISNGADGATERDALVTWLDQNVLPHVRAELEVLAQLATAETKGFVESAQRDADALVAQAAELRNASGVPAAVTAGGIRSLIASHVTALDEQALPALAAVADVSLADVFAARPEILTAAPAAVEETAQPGGHSCGCGGHDEPGHPELDARAIPHAIRHATIFGALEGVRPGSGMVLVAPHDPIPLLGQIAARWPGVFEVSYLQRGPEDWRLLFQRG